MSKMRIAVVGSGISGINAARVLQNNGFKVSVYEKSRGSGGRMSTRRASGFEFDHGAQFFTARDPLLIDQVKSWTANGLAQPWQGRFAIVGGQQTVLETKNSIRYVGVPRMSSLIRNFASGIQIEYSTRITRLKRNKEKWYLSDQQKKIPAGFDSVILAIPPQQAVDLLDRHAEHFPELRRISMLPCWAVMVVFEQPLELTFDAAFVHNSSLSWIARNSSKPDRNGHECWVLHGSPQWSRDHIDEDPDSVSEALLETFFVETGHPVVNTRWIKAHRWRYALADEPLTQGCLWQPDLSLGICGDWCFKSRVEGAFLSGNEIARKVIETWQQKIGD